MVNPSTGKFKGEVELELSTSTTSKASSTEEHTAFEYQRWQAVVGWGSDYPGHLLPTDPGRCVTQGYIMFYYYLNLNELDITDALRLFILFVCICLYVRRMIRWCSGDGRVFKPTFEEVVPPVPDGWFVSSAWKTVATTVFLSRVTFERLFIL